LSFTILLLVALTTFIRVETQSSVKLQNALSARQNALFALDLALAQLQRHTGPDQRVTAPADLIASTDSSNSPTSSPSGIVVQSASRFWTGVWGNSDSDIGYDLEPDDFEPGYNSPVLLNWLVSGNESNRFSHNTDGTIIDSNSSPFTPESSISNIGPSSNALSRPSLVNGSNTVEGALLVGANSTSDGSVSASQTSFDQGKYVVAPLVDLENENQVSGRYAWWVGDEGVKARIDQQNGYQQTGQSDDQFYSFLVAQRDAIEFVEDADGLQLGTDDYDSTDANLSRLHFREDLAYLLPSAEDRLKNTAKARFHDLSTHTLGVLSDSYAGGLKKNLTADIFDVSGDASYRPSDSDNIFPLLSNNEPYLPTWGLLRSWARTAPNSSSKITPTILSESAASIAPVITNASLGMNYYIEGANDTFVMALYPMIVLYNPYPYTLKATNFDIAFQMDGPGRIYIRVDPDGDGDADGDGIDDDGNTEGYSNVAIFNLETASIYFANPIPSPIPDNNYFRFQVRGSDIPPGESHIYCLPESADGSDYNALSGFSLERAPNSDAIGTTFFVKLTGPDLASSGLSYDPSVAYIQLKCNDLSYSASNPSELDFVLAEQGALSTGPSLVDLDPAAANNWYQCVTNAVTRLGWNSSQTLFDGEDGYSVFEDRRAIGGYAPLTNATGALRLTGNTEMLNGWLPGLRMGISSRDIRFHATHNFRAPIIEPTIYERQNKPTTSNQSNSGAVIMGSALIGMGSDKDDWDNPHQLYLNHRYAMNFGQSFSANPPGGNTSKDLHHSIFFDLLESPNHLLSLGQLQNAPFSRYSFQPAYPFANSYADPRIPRDQTYQDSIVMPLAGGGGTLPAYDLSWLMNRALWDRYFLSGIPSDWTQNDLDDQEPFPNSRITVTPFADTPPTLSTIQSGRDAYNEAAAHLMVDGSFNINSTSEQAWRAVLAGSYGISAADAEAYAAADDRIQEVIPFPRFSHNITEILEANDPYPAVNQTMITEGDYTLVNFYKTAFSGNRGLYLGQPAEDLPENASPEAVVNELARSIVAEIRKRGPFLTLADFVNRPLTSSNDNLGIKGALQAGIDGMKYDAAQANPYYLTSRDGRGDFSMGIANYEGHDIPPDWDPDHSVGGPVSEYRTEADAYMNKQAMAPFFLTQADILSSLGPRMSARSDTFLIRTYGEAVNLEGEIESRAWCEAVVQRTPEYVDPSDEPYDDASGVNAVMGRGYEVVSLRWISPDKI
ncbi:MAG: hypothetical protein ACQKBT_12160, partial [Puniceicoccales bacterium]